MGRIKDTLVQAKDKIKNGPKGKQGRAFFRILQFFAIMLVLTIFARGAAGVTMPAVQVTSLSTQTIKNSEEFSGIVNATNREKIKIPAGLSVSQVYVSSGSHVEEGDTLISFDTKDITLKITEQRLAVQELRLKLAELQKPLKEDDEALKSAQRAKQEAQEMLDRAYADKQKNVNRATEALQRATAAREAMEKQPEFDIDELNALIEAERTAQQALNDAVEAGDRDIETAQKSLTAANEALAEAEKSYNEGKPSHNLNVQKQQLEISKTKQEIEKQQELLEKLELLEQEGGAIKSTIKGSVAEVSVASGATTTEEDFVAISTGTEGYMVEFSAPQASVRQLKVGGVVNVQLDNYYWGSEGRISGKSMPDENGNVTVRAQLTGTDWSDGDSAKVTAVFSDKKYSTCVPVAAVRPDSEGYYVYVLAEESTILGTQTVARKVPVTVADKDKKYAAIEGVYEGNVQVIVTSNKPVNDGDMVRIEEAD